MVRVYGLHTGACSFMCPLYGGEWSVSIEMVFTPFGGQSRRFSMVAVRGRAGHFPYTESDYHTKSINISFQSMGSSHRDDDVNSWPNQCMKMCAAWCTCLLFKEYKNFVFNWDDQKPKSTIDPFQMTTVYSMKSMYMASARNRL